MSNLYRQFLQLLPRDPLQVGTVTAHNDDETSDVQLPGNQTVRVRGQLVPIGDQAFVKGGEVLGPAPDLPTFTAEI